MTLASILSAVLAATTFHVAPNGDDARSGRSPKEAVKTLARALDLARGVLADGEKVILLADGTYFLETPVVMGEGDRDITFRALHRGKAVISGAVKVTGWRKDPKDARFLVADFPFEPQQETLYTLTLNGRLCDFSAYPQLGGAEKLRYPATNDDVRKNNRRVFEYDPEDLPNGGDYRDLDISSAYVFIPQEWASTTTYIATNDWRNNTFYLKKPTDMPIGRFNTGYQIMNTRFGLKAPGTWMFSVRDRQIVCWPHEGVTAANAVGCVSKAEALFDISKTRHVKFEGLVLEGCAARFNAGVYQKGFLPAAIGGYGPAFTEVTDCEIRDVAGNGFEVVKGDDCTFRRTHVHHVGSTGVQFADGGVRTTIVDCEVNDTGLLRVGGMGFGVYSYATIQRSRIHDIGGVGISMWSMYSLVESNEIYRTMTAMRDGGGVYGAQVYSVFRDNWCHDNGDWPGLYNDEGGRDTLYVGNRFEDSWWPFHMHDCRRITVVSNVFSNAGGMRYSFQGSTRCVFRDNLIRTELPIDRDPYVVATDVWDNRVQLKGKDGAYGEERRLVLRNEPLPPRAGTAAWRVAAPLRVEGSGAKAAFAGGPITGPWISVGRSREGYPSSGVPGAWCRMGFDGENLYVMGRYEYNKLGPYDGELNYGLAWGVHDALRFHLGQLKLTVFFLPPKEAGRNGGVCGRIVSSDPSLAFSSNNCYIVTGSWRQSSYGFVVPLRALGLAGDPVGRSIPFNFEFYNADHDEWRYFEKPDEVGLFGRLFGRDEMLSSTLEFSEVKVDPTGLVDVRERFADGTCAFPGAIWPEGGVVQAGPATCERRGEGYKQPLTYDNHNAELIGYILSGRPRLQGFAMLPFSMKKDPSGEGRFTKRMDDSSMSVRPDRFWVKTENWDLGTEATASENCGYLRFEYGRGGPFRVQLDAQDVAPAWWLKDRAKAKVEVTAAESSVKDGVFEGFVTAKVNGREEKVFAKMQFEPKPVAVRELKANGRKGRRYILEFLLMPQTGNVQVKAALSPTSAADAAARFAADGEAIDFAARNAACKEAWRAFLAAHPTDLKGAEQRAHYTRLYRDRVRANLDGE